MSDPRAAGGTGTPVPVVPPSAGPRILVILSALMVPLGVFLLIGAVAWGGAALAGSVGLADRSTSQVTERSLETSDQYSRGCQAQNEYIAAGRGLVDAPVVGPQGASRSVGRPLARPGRRVHERLVAEGAMTPTPPSVGLVAWRGV